MTRAVGVIRVPYERASVPPRSPLFTRPPLLNQGGFGQKGKGLEYEPLQHVRRSEAVLLLVVLRNLGLVDFLQVVVVHVMLRFAGDDGGQA